MSVLWLLCLPLLAQAAVYECADRDGSRRFQARPCANASASRLRNDLPELTRVAPTRATSPVRTPGRRPAGGGVSLPYTEAAVVSCRVARDRVNALDRRLRAGYTAAEAAGLNSRRRRLLERRARACASVPQYRWMRG